MLIEIPRKMSLQETFDINYCFRHCYCTFIGCRQKKDLYNLDKKKLIKISQKEEKSYKCMKA